GSCRLREDPGGAGRNCESAKIGESAKRLLRSMRMGPIEIYEFDRCGYLVIRDLLAEDQVAALRAAVDDLEAHARRHLGRPPEKKSPWGPIYHANAERGYHVDGSSDHGKTMIIEDFFNADPAFDFLVDHPRTMDYIRSIVQGPVRINNSEIR